MGDRVWSKSQGQGQGQPPKSLVWLVSLVVVMSCTPPALPFRTHPSGVNLQYSSILHQMSYPIVIQCLWDPPSTHMVTRYWWPPCPGVLVLLLQTSPHPGTTTQYPRMVTCPLCDHRAYYMIFTRSSRTSWGLVPALPPHPHQCFVRDSNPKLRNARVAR